MKNRISAVLTMAMVVLLVSCQDELKPLQSEAKGKPPISLPNEKPDISAGKVELVGPPKPNLKVQSWNFDPETGSGWPKLTYSITNENYESGLYVRFWVKMARTSDGGIERNWYVFHQGDVECYSDKTPSTFVNI